MSQVVDVDIFVRRPIGVTGPVTLSAKGGPPGLELELVPAVLQSGQEDAQMRLRRTVLLFAADGQYPVTIAATAPGAVADSAIVVVDLLPPPRFTVRATPEQLYAVPGGSASARIEVVRSRSYRGAVTFDVAPNTRVNPQIQGSTPDVRDLVVTPGTLAPLGSEVVTVTVRGSEELEDWEMPVKIPVTVIAQSATVVTWTYCQGSAPSALAHQPRRNGPWVRVSPTPAANGSTFQMSFPEGTGGIAVVPQGSEDQWFLFGTTEELRREAPDCAPATRPASLSLVGVAPTDSIVVSHGEGLSLLGSWRPTHPNHQLVVPDQPFDLLAQNVPSGCTALAPLDRYVLRRGTVASAGVLPALDWATTTKVQPTRRRVSIVGAAGAKAIILTTLRTAGGTRAFLGRSETLASSEMTCALPAAVGISGDMHEVTVALPGRDVTHYVAGDGDLQASLGPPSAPQVTLGSGRLRFTADPSYADRLRVFFGNNVEGVSTIDVHKGYGLTLEERGNTQVLMVDLAIPNLSNLPGWTGAFFAGGPSITAESWTGPPGSWRRPPPGTVIRRSHFQ